MFEETVTDFVTQTKNKAFSSEKRAKSFRMTFSEGYSFLFIFIDQPEAFIFKSKQSLAKL